MRFACGLCHLLLVSEATNFLDLVQCSHTVALPNASKHNVVFPSCFSTLNGCHVCAKMGLGIQAPRPPDASFRHNFSKAVVTAWSHQAHRLRSCYQFPQVQLLKTPIMHTTDLKSWPRTPNVPASILNGCHCSVVCPNRFHAEGIEVILDVVYNHTVEGDDHDPYLISFRGIDPEVYYMMDHSQPTPLLNLSGCGNTVSGNHPVVKQLIIDSLVTWVEEYHVDGFRFDLASCLCRGKNQPLRISRLEECLFTASRATHHQDGPASVWKMQSKQTMTARCIN